MMPSRKLVGAVSKLVGALSRLVIAPSTLLACLVAAPARSADPPPAWRLLVGPSLTLPSFATTYTSRYSPAFQYVPHTSDATQTLPLDAGKGPGAWLGIERALGRHVGLQLSGHYGQADLSGIPGHYDLTMRYTSRPPPFYDPVDVTVQRSEAQPPAEGTLKTIAVALDLVGWADVGARGRVGLSAGPAWVHSKGEAQSLVYTAYFMGGHSVAFPGDYRVSFDCPASALGLDVGGFAEVDLGGHAGLRVDARYCWAPEKEAEVSVREVLNPEDITRTLDPADIQAGLAPAPVPLDPSFFRASIALSLRF
jgi:hypothetical protein